MRFIQRKFIPLCFLAAISATTLHAQKTESEVRVVTPENLAAIQSAMPDSLPVPAKQARKVLVYSKSMTYYHLATPLGKTFLKEVERQYDGYTFVFSDDPEDYRYEKLKEYDAVFINNSTRIELVIKDPEILKGFIRFIEEGGGFMGIHAAADGGCRNIMT